jgi:hypothetical protein
MLTERSPENARCACIVNRVPREGRQVAHDSAFALTPAEYACQTAGSPATQNVARGPIGLPTPPQLPSSTQVCPKFPFAPLCVEDLTLFS